MPRHPMRLAQILWPIFLLMAGNAVAQESASDVAGLGGCAISAWSTDKDRSGLNVRAGPGIAYPVIGRLPPPQQLDGEEYATEVNIVGSKDGWFRINSATTNNYGDADAEVVFEGDGWVSGRFLGRSVEGQYLYGAPSRHAPVIFDFHDWPGDRKGADYFSLERLLSCKGWWVEVEGTFLGKHLRGWTDDTCGSQVTTCP
ncbi:hypothetical protein MesoLjLb_75060 [Mesorhizobium sp. L-8-3]|nr:hypothetical protein MesoLjLb_75060 [Mesorhizobium sp. L-8-3]